MRKLYALSRALGLAAGLGLVGATAAYAQIGYDYTSAVDTVTTYTSLATTDGKVINTANKDDANSTAQPIGFTFHYNGADFTQFVLNTNGLIRLGATAPSSTKMFVDFENNKPTGTDPIGSTSAKDINLLMPFNTDLQNGTATGGTEYRVATTGSGTSHVCTIQFKNVRDKKIVASPQYSSFSFQIKLYETTNTIEYVYGSATAAAGTTDGARYAVVGLKGSQAADNQVLTAQKVSKTKWWGAVFYTDEETFNFRSTVLPDAGRTIRFTLPTCAVPYKLTATATTTTTATISFTGPANAGGYTVIYGVNGFTSLAQAKQVSAPSSPFTITGLASGTNYDVYVQTNCSATDASIFSGGANFTTACADAQLTISKFPYYQGFDSTAVDALPCAYSVLDVKKDTTTWTLARDTVGKAGHAMVYSYNAHNKADDWFFTAPFQLKAGHTYQLGFKYRAASADYPEALEVRYGTTATPASQTSLLFTQTGIKDTTYVATTAKSVQAFTPTADGKYYIGFHAISDADEAYLLVDDLTVTESAPLAVKNAANSVFRADASPVPFGSYLHLSLNTHLPGAVRLTMRDALGRTVRETHAAVSAGAATLVVPEVATLPAGVYFLEVEQAGLRQVLRVAHE